MINMLSRFDLKPGEDWDTFSCYHDNFLNNLLVADLIIDAD
jgi:hypothetical protein